MDIYTTKTDPSETDVEPLATTDILNILNWPAIGTWDSMKHLDFRSEAITACGAWALARNQFLKDGAPFMGLVRRSKLMAVARSLAPTMQSQPGCAEHVDAISARLACIDWISYTISRCPALLSKKNANYLDRFFWGYLERTSEFDVFFEARKQGLALTTPKAKALTPLITRQCFIGCAYGAPTLAAMIRGTGGIKGRGKYHSIFIDDMAYAVLAKNGAGAQLLQMEYTGAGLRRNADGVLDQDVADKLLALVDERLPASKWPAFIVQRAGQPRMALHLMPGRRGNANADLAADPLWWRRIRGSLLDVVTETRMREFRPNADGANWGTFEQILWHLTPVPGNARTHIQFFGALPISGAGS